MSVVFCKRVPPENHSIRYVTLSHIPVPLKSSTVHTNETPVGSSCFCFSVSSSLKVMVGVPRFLLLNSCGNSKNRKRGINKSMPILGFHLKSPNSRIQNWEAHKIFTFIQGKIT